MGQTNFCPVPQQSGEPTFINDSNDTNSESNHDYDIEANLGGASPAHVWMTELQFNSKEAQYEDYEDIQDHERQDKQNK